MSKIDPTITAELRRQRGLRHLTRKEVAQAMDWHDEKVYRIERGIVSISIVDLRALLAHYKISDEDHVEALVNLARKQSS